MHYFTKDAFQNIIIVTMPRVKQPRPNCLNCGTSTARPTYKYCSNKCQGDFQFRVYIQRWLAGDEVGLQRLGVVSRHIKRYLRVKYSNKCCLCGWSELNIYSGVVPLVADHIDGDWRNNIESNLRLICPNCDSLTETYAALNKGRGRKDRVVSNRVKEAQLMKPLPPNKYKK